MKIILTGILAVIYFSANAQVGVGTVSIHPSAMFQVESENKGFLMPSVTGTEAVGSSPSSVADGLLIYDENSHSFKVFSQSKWQTVNPWKASTSGQNITYQGKVGINTEPDASAESLQVNGSVKSTGNIKVENTGQFEGYGTIPLGGIILWSGTTPPDGWALCNGQTVNGYTTPDLKGKFIVSYSPSETDYSDPGNLSTKGNDAGNTGGAATVTLQKQNVPAHIHEKGSYSVLGIGSHSHSYTYDSAFTNNSESGANKQVITRSDLGIDSEVPITFTGGSHTHTIEGSSGNGTTDGLGSVPHENRPPYYVLAFIMRVR